jgi:hypothetical protein
MPKTRASGGERIPLAARIIPIKKRFLPVIVCLPFHVEEGGHPVSKRNFL